MFDSGQPKSICRKYFRQCIFVSIALALLTSYAYAQTSPQVKTPVNLKMATFKSGSGWHVLGANIASVIKEYLPKGSIVDVLPYSGGVGNCLLLDRGKADIALGFPVETGLAIKGLEPYDEPIPDLRALVGRTDTYWFAFAVRSDSGIRSIDQIKNQKYPLRLAILPKGSSGEWMTRTVLNAYGISYSDIKSWGGKVMSGSFAAAVALIKENKADAFGQVCTPGHPTWTELCTTVNMNFLPVKEDIINKLADKYGYVKGVIPEGAFRGVKEDISTLGFYTMLITTSDLPEDVAYIITKAVCENKPRIVSAYKAFEVFDPKTAWKVPVPLHEGARKYYEEMGLM